MFQLFWRNYWQPARFLLAEVYLYFCEFCCKSLVAQGANRACWEKGSRNPFPMSPEGLLLWPLASAGVPAVPVLTAISKPWKLILVSSNRNRSKGFLLVLWTMPLNRNNLRDIACPKFISRKQCFLIPSSYLFKQSNKIQQTILNPLNEWGKFP